MLAAQLALVPATLSTCRAPISKLQQLRPPTAAAAAAAVLANFEVAPAVAAPETWKWHLRFKYVSFPLGSLLVACESRQQACESHQQHVTAVPICSPRDPFGRGGSVMNPLLALVTPNCSTAMHAQARTRTRTHTYNPPPSHALATPLPHTHLHARAHTHTNLPHTELRPPSLTHICMYAHARARAHTHTHTNTHTTTHMLLLATRCSSPRLPRTFPHARTHTCSS